MLCLPKFKQFRVWKHLENTKFLCKETIDSRHHCIRMRNTTHLYWHELNVESANQFKANFAPRAFPLENRKSPEDKVRWKQPGTFKEVALVQVKKENKKHTETGPIRGSLDLETEPPELLRACSQNTQSEAMFIIITLCQRVAQKTIPIMWRPIFKICVEQLFSVTKTALKSPS